MAQPNGTLQRGKLVDSLLLSLTCMLMIGCTSQAPIVKAKSTEAKSATDEGDSSQSKADDSEESGTESERTFTRYDAVVASLTIFFLAVFLGFELITKVPPTLHTPLMSGSNAVSGITLVGALLSAGSGNLSFAALLGCMAVIMATVNVVGGFLVTHRMLMMFRRK